MPLSYLHQLVGFYQGTSGEEKVVVKVWRCEITVAPSENCGVRKEMGYLWETRKEVGRVRKGGKALREERERGGRERKKVKRVREEGRE